MIILQPNLIHDFSGRIITPKTSNKIQNTFQLPSQHVEWHEIYIYIYIIIIILWVLNKCDKSYLEIYLNVIL